MNPTQLKSRRKEQIQNAIIALAVIAGLWFANYFGMIENLNPFDGK